MPALAAVLLLLLPAPALGASRVAPPVQLTDRSFERLEISLEQLSGNAAGRHYALKWDSSGKNCQGVLSNDRKIRGWKRLRPGACQGLTAFLRTSRAVLQQQISSRNPLDRSDPASGISGSLSFLGVSFRVNLTTGASCNAGRTDCEKPERSLPSEIGLRLRKILTAELGHLPPVRRELTR